MAATRPLARSLTPGALAIPQDSMRTSESGINRRRIAPFAGGKIDWGNMLGKDGISNIIIVNRGRGTLNVKATLEEALIEIEFGEKRNNVLSAMHALTTISGELKKGDLWDVIAAFCKMAENRKIDADVRIEAIEMICFMHGIIERLRKGDLAIGSESQKFVQEGLPAPDPQSIREAAKEELGEHMETETGKALASERDMAYALLELTANSNERIVETARGVMGKIDSPLIREEILF